MALDDYTRGAQWGYSLAWVQARDTADRYGAEGVIRGCIPGRRVGVHPRDGGSYSLYCFDCGEWVPNTANNEMRREHVFAHSHVCKAQREDSHD